MTTYPELIRTAAAGVHEVRRTQSPDLTRNMIRDLFVIAEGLQDGQPAEAVAEQLAALGFDIPPAPLADRYCGYQVTFIGQAWIMDNAMPVDDGRFTFYATEAEVLDANEGDGVFDGLSDAERAPAEVKNWPGPFEIRVERRPFRITGCAALDSYADDLAGLREVLAELEPTEAGLARAFLPRETPDPSRTIPGVLGEFHVDNRRWDVIAQEVDVDPEDLQQAA